MHGMRANIYLLYTASFSHGRLQLVTSEQNRNRKRQRPAIHRAAKEVSAAGAARRRAGLTASSPGGWESSSCRCMACPWVGPAISAPPPCPGHRRPASSAESSNSLAARITLQHCMHQQHRHRTTIAITAMDAIVPVSSQPS
jgi:hypothetical protein